MATLYGSAIGRNWFAGIAERLRRYFTLKCELLTRRRGKADATRAHAIAVLRDQDASPDLRDWAERYLCGLAEADPSKYFDDHKWQS